MSNGNGPDYGKEWGVSYRPPAPTTRGQTPREAYSAALMSAVSQLDAKSGATTAMGILDQAASEMNNRSETYDKPEGERSMGATVAAFTAITGVQMSEQQGWQFMEVLKMVRSNQGAYRADSFIDGAAYAALAGEAAARDTPTP